MRALALFALVACGGSKPATTATAPPAPASDAPKTTIEIAATLAQGPGNIAMHPDGRMFVSQHQFYNPEHTVVEVKQQGAETVPVAPGAVDSVLGIRTTEEGLVWMLDNGMRNKTPRKLALWDPDAAGVRVWTFDLMAASPDNAFLNDLAVDVTNRHVYIADPAGGKNAALIAVDIADRNNPPRRVLEGHESVVPSDIDLVIDGTPVQIKQPDGTTIRPRVGVNPIALDASDEWLYFGPMHSTKLYRVRTAELRDPMATPNVELYAERPITDGISIDTAGNIYLGDLANNAIGVIDARTRKYRELVRDPRLSWVDAFSYAPDGHYYAVTNQLHRSAVLNGGVDATKPPFHIVRFKPLAPGRVGR